MTKSRVWRPASISHLRLNEVQRLDKAPEHTSAEDDAGDSPTVVELLALKGIPADQAELWIRRELFNVVARCFQDLWSGLGAQQGLHEHELIRDFARCQCTEDVIDSLHQYQKMRGEPGIWRNLLGAHHGKVLKVYWRLRRETDPDMNRGRGDEGGRQLAA